MFMIQNNWTSIYETHWLTISQIKQHRCKYLAKQWPRISCRVAFREQWLGKKSARVHGGSERMRERECVCERERLAFGWQYFLPTNWQHFRSRP